MQRRVNYLALTFLLVLMILRSINAKMRLDSYCSRHFPPEFEKGREKPILYSLDESGTFHRCDVGNYIKPQLPRQVTYSVLDNGILVPGRGPYPIDYSINKRGDFVPELSNTCIYKSDKTAYFLKGSRNILIPVEVQYCGQRAYYIFKGKYVLYSQPEWKHRIIQVMNKNATNVQPRSMWLTDGTKMEKEERGALVVPDKTCNGNVTLFLLTSRGHLVRNPPDEFLPNGMRLSYQLKDDGSLVPQSPTRRGILNLAYRTAENGNLNPCASNSHTLQTMEETTKCYLLGEGGVLAPVTELQANRTISYFYDGRLVHSSSQFQQIYSNTSMVFLNKRSKQFTETQVKTLNPGPKFECSFRKIAKREAVSCCQEPPTGLPSKQTNLCGYVFDDRGKRIPLDPFINDKGGVVIYKLTCKGYFKRMDPYNEPEHGFTLKFKMLASYILVHSRKSENNGIIIKYSLKPNGDLAPLKRQKYNFKKAPASVVYYYLNSKKQLLPVKALIVSNGNVEIYYQDCLIYTIQSCQAKEMELLTTYYAPLYAYLNSRITVIQYDQALAPRTSATWADASPKLPNLCRNLYLIGPNKCKVKIEVELNERNIPCIYEMDWNGLFHKSPKDDKKTMSLKTFKLLPEGILLPTNETNEYIYLVDKEGNMLPYCYPDSKLRAPYGLTVKYVKCKTDILLPILVEATAELIRFSFESTVIYFKKCYSIEEIVEYTELQVEFEQEKTKLFTDIYLKDNGKFVYFQRKGKVFYRCPKRKIAEYLINHTGYLEIKKSGVLEPQTYPHPQAKQIKIQIEDDGRIIIIEDKTNTKIGTDFLLAKNGSLIPVNVERKNGCTNLYKDGIEITQIKGDCESINDPYGLFNNSEPEKTTCKSPQQIVIPVCSNVPEKPIIIDKKKCEMIRTAVKEMLAKDPTMSGVELEMNDKVMKEIYQMVCQCSNIRKVRSMLENRDISNQMQSLEGPDDSSSSQQDGRC